MISFLFNFFSQLQSIITKLVEPLKIKNDSLKIQSLPDYFKWWEKGNFAKICFQQIYSDKF